MTFQFLQPPVGGASADRAGTMPAAAYAAFAGVAPTDPTGPVATTGATGTYSEATGVAFTTTLDSIAATYKRCHSLGHVGAGKLVPTVICPGFGGGAASYSSDFMHRLADYVDPDSGRAPLVLVADTRGRGGTSGQIDYVRDLQDMRDMVAHAVNAVGAANCFAGGRGVVLVAQSTGAVDALLWACRCPDEVLAVVLLVPNFDLGVDATDGYWAIHDSIRAQLTSRVGDRAQGSAAAMDPYLARNPIDGIARILALPGAPPVWVFGDRTEAPLVPITNPDRLVRALKASPAAAAKVHDHISQSGDAIRYLHDTGTFDNDLGGALSAEKRYWPPILAGVAEWTLPQSTPPNGFRVFGWFKARAVTGSANPADDRVGFEIWTGAANPPKPDSAGGHLHALEMHYVDGGRAFTFDPQTSQDGYIQVIRDADDRRVAFTAGSQLRVDLGVAPTITSIADLSAAHLWHADAGTTGTTQLSAWVDSIGGLTLGASSAWPALTTDADNKACIRFSGAQKLTLAQLLVDPTADFTVILVCARSAISPPQIVFDVAHHGTNARMTIQAGSSTSAGFLYNNAGSVALANQNGIGGQSWSTNAKKVVVLRQLNGVLAMSVNNSAWNKSAIQNNTFTKTGTNETTIGAGWAPGAGTHYAFWTGDVYTLATWNVAKSESDLNAAIAHLKTKWSF